MGKAVSVRYENPGEAVSTIVEGYPKFVAACIRLAQYLGDRLSSISINFKLAPHGPIVAEIAWRNEVVAVLEHYRDCRTAEYIHFSDPGREVYRQHMYSEEQARRELPTLLQIHLKQNLRESEGRVRHARVALEILDPDWKGKEVPALTAAR